VSGLRWEEVAMLAGISVECVQVEALGLIDTGRATGRSSIANNA